MKKKDEKGCKDTFVICLMISTVELSDFKDFVKPTIATFWTLHVVIQNEFVNT